MIQVIGKVQNRKVLGRLLKLELMTKRKIRHALFEVGQEHVKEIRASMAEKKSGRVYKINGASHIASAPGEAPAIRTMDLQRSVYYKVHGWNQLEIGAKEAYARYLELGTFRGGIPLMEPRQFILPSIQDQSRNTYNTLLKYNLEVFQI